MECLNHNPNAGGFRVFVFRFSLWAFFDFDDPVLLPRCISIVEGHFCGKFSQYCYICDCLCAHPVRPRWTQQCLKQVIS
eukprot:CCRYP_004680-RA/>CCRYP_004680-RA protein AED:0.08 eAED:0.08 QI:120/1/1/1/0/0/2/31/78